MSRENSKQRKQVVYIRSCRTCGFADFTSNKCHAPVPQCILDNLFKDAVNKKFTTFHIISYDKPCNYCKSWSTATRMAIRDRFKKFETIVSSELF